MADIDVNAMLKDYIKNLCKDNGVKDSSAIEIIGILDSELNCFEGDTPAWNNDNFRKINKHMSSDTYRLEKNLKYIQQELGKKENELKATKKTFEDKRDMLEPLRQLEDRNYSSKMMETYRKMRPEIKRMYNFLKTFQNTFSEKNTSDKYKSGCGGCGGCGAD